MQKRAHEMALVEEINELVEDRCELDWGYSKSVRNSPALCR